MRRLFPLLALLLLVGVACGGGGASSKGAASDPVAVFAAMEDKAKQAGSVRFEMVLSVTGEGVGSVETKTSGAFDYADERGTIVMDLGDVAGASLGVRRLDAVVDGETMYLGIPKDRVAQANGRHWLKVDARGAGVGSSLGNSNPVQFVTLVSSGAASVEEVGTDQIQGETAVQYRLELDLDKAGDTLPPEQRQSLQALLGAASGGTVPMQVWVIDGLPRRLVTTFEQQGTKGRMMIDLFDYGADVDVEVPKSSDVLEASQEDMARIFAPKGSQ